MQNLKNIWPVVLLPVMLLVFFSGTLSVLHTWWVKWDQAYSHGYLIVGLLCFWVVRESLHYGLAQDKKSWPLAFLALVGALFAWYSGKVIQFQVLEQVALLGISWSWLWVVGGWRLARHLIAPFCIGLLAIPLWDVFISPLQDLTVFVVSHVTQAIGITAYIENNTVELPYGMLVVADGCAGLNLFLVSLSIGAIYSYMYLKRTRSMAICISLLLMVGIFSNWLRVFSLVVIGYVSHMESSLVYEHGTFGWMIFAGVLGVFFYFYRRVEKHATPPLECKESLSLLRHSGFWFAMAAIIAFPTWVSLVEKRGQQTYMARQLTLPGIEVVEIDQPPWQPTISGEDIRQHWRLEQAGNPTYLSVFSYTSQRQGKELIYYSNRIAEKYDMEAIPLGSVVSEGMPSLKGAVVKSESQHFVVLWVYKVGAWYTHSQLVAKLLQLPASFSASHVAELITWSLPCDTLQSSCAAEKKALEAGEYSTLLHEVFMAIDNTALRHGG